MSHHHKLKIVKTLALLCCASLMVLLSACPSQASGVSENNSLERIAVADEGTSFVLKPSGISFSPWGVNYDHDSSGRLIEDYWQTEWDTVVEDFREIKALGANVVRIHLQFGKFMDAPDQASQTALNQLAKLITLAEQTGVYLDITGLACYHKADIPEWYDKLSEAQRWKAQAVFWGGVARTCKDSSAIFCYDLMNEPILPSAVKVSKEWLADKDLGGKFFVQRIALDLAGRDRNEVARAWVDSLVNAIRKHDNTHLITVGVIPWAHVWPNANPLFYSPSVSENLDFVSVHFYPKKGKVDVALAALKKMTSANHS